MTQSSSPLRLTPAAINKGIARLGERITELEAFDVGTLVNGRSPELTALEVAIKDTLNRCFGEKPSAYILYERAASLHYYGGVSRRSPVDYTTPTRRNIGNAIALLKQAKLALEEDMTDSELQLLTASPASSKPVTAARSRRVFVVHGHDDAALQGLARFLEKLGLEAIILKEQPDQGRTIIEKFEDSAVDVGFAVVLLTPDDLGGSVKADSPGARARQNVIFELGYFAGKLGRGHVCLLRKGHVEIPSDLYGVIYTDMDPADGWKAKLVGELKAAKLDFDANRFWQ